MNRTELQALARERSLDAEALLAAGRRSGAYYVAGYAVECALKACIAKLTNAHDFPDKRHAERSFVHDLEKLLDVAGLKSQRDADGKSNIELALRWNRMNKWNEQARYSAWTEADARDLVDAVNHPQDGVLAWITARW